MKQSVSVSETVNLNRITNAFLHTALNTISDTEEGKLFGDLEMSK